MSLNDSLIDRIRCGMSIDDPIFAPINQDEKTAPANDAPDQPGDPGDPFDLYVTKRSRQSAGSAGAGSTGTNSGASPGIGGTGSLGSQVAQQVADVIVIVKDPAGDVGVVGPFLNDDEAFNYVKNCGICSDGFWIKVTNLLTP